MNLRQLRYAVLLAETGSFSLTAEKQGITQPALSKHVLSLEKELGTQLFYRNQSPVRLTAAGEYFIREAKELLYREESLSKAMQQFSEGEKGQLVIGITPFRSSYLIASVIKAVREKFPGVAVRLIEEGSDKLRHDVIDGRFDFAVVNMPVDESMTEVYPIEADKLSLVLSPSLYEIHEKLRDKKEIDFSECHDIPFVVPGANQEMRLLFEKLCRSTDTFPETVCEVVSLTTAREIAVSGVGATLLPVQFVKNEIEDGKLVAMEIKNDITARRPAVVFRRGQYKSPYACYAAMLLTGESI